MVVIVNAHDHHSTNKQIKWQKQQQQKTKAKQKTKTKKTTTTLNVFIVFMGMPINQDHKQKGH